jgi:hypothetical protein
MAEANGRSAHTRLRLETAGAVMPAPRFDQTIVLYVGAFILGSIVLIVFYDKPPLRCYEGQSRDEAIDRDCPVLEAK